MGSESERLHGLKILVVEDAFLIALDLCVQLEKQGCIVVGPAARLGRALELARNEPLDAAILDVNLAGESSFPVAEALGARKLPFVFLSGYADAGTFPPEFREAPRLTKPCDSEEMVRALASHCVKPRRMLGGRAASRVTG